MFAWEIDILKDFYTNEELENMSIKEMEEEVDRIKSWGEEDYLLNQ